MSQDNVSSFTGRPLQDLTIDKVLGGELTAEDFRTNAGTLREQADKAEAAGYRLSAVEAKMIDLRSHRVPNWLSLGGAVLALVAYAGLPAIGSWPRTCAGRLS